MRGTDPATLVRTMSNGKFARCEQPLNLRYAWRLEMNDQSAEDTRVVAKPKVWRLSGKDIHGLRLVWFTEDAEEAEMAIKRGWQSSAFCEVNPDTPIYELDGRYASMIEHGMSNMNWRPQDLVKPSENPHLREWDDIRDELLERAYDYLSTLEETNNLCECGSPECRTAKLRSSIAKAAALTTTPEAK